MRRIKPGDIVYVDVTRTARRCRVIARRWPNYLLMPSDRVQGDINLLIKRNRTQIWVIPDQTRKYVEKQS